MDVWTVGEIACLPKPPPPKLVALMLVRNEDWVLNLSLRAALRWCDAVYVYCHKCHDGTQDIIDTVDRQNPGRVARAWSEADDWNEMDMRQTLLQQGRKWGATHFALVDADEVPTANWLAYLRQRALALNPGEAMDVPMIPCWRSLHAYRNDNSIWCKSRISVAFADKPGVCWKADNGYQHHHRLPYGVTAKRVGERGAGGVMHLQFANWPRLAAKHAWYKCVEITRFTKRTREEIDRVYNQALDESNLRTAECPKAWWEGHDTSCVDFQSEPWHKAECKRLWDLHGADTFRGLNLFGVAP